MLNQTFGEVAVAQLRPPDRRANAGTSLVNAIGSALNTIVEGRAAREAEANQDANVLSSIEGVIQVELDKQVEAGNLSREQADAFRNNPDDRRSRLESAGFNQLNNGIRTKILKNVETADAIKEQPGDARQIARDRGVGFADNEFNRQTRELEDDSVDQEFRRADTIAREIGVNIRSFSPDKEEATAAFYRSGAYRQHLETNRLKAKLSRKEVNDELSSQDATLLASSEVLRDSQELRGVGEAYEENAGGDLASINGPEFIADLNRTYSILLDNARATFVDNPDAFEEYKKGLDNERELQENIYGGSNINTQQTRDKNSIDIRIQQKNADRVAELNLQQQEADLILTRVRGNNEIIKSEEGIHKLRTSYYTNRKEYKDSLLKAQITGPQLDSLMEEYDTGFESLQRLVIDTHRANQDAVTRYLSPALRGEESINVKVGNLFGALATGDLPPESLLSLVHTVRNVSANGTVNQRRLLRDKILQNAHHPQIQKIAEETLEARELVPELRLAYQERVLEPLIPIIDELSEISFTAIELGDVGVFTEAGQAFVIDSDLFNKSGRMQLKMKNNLSKLLSTELGALQKLGVVMERMNVKLDRVDTATAIDSYENFARNGSRLASLEDIIAHSTKLEGLLVDDLNPEAVFADKAEAVREFFGTADSSRARVQNRETTARLQQEEIESRRQARNGITINSDSLPAGFQIDESSDIPPDEQVARALLGLNPTEDN